jgi:hypothetical protein
MCVLSSAGNCLYDGTCMSYAMRGIYCKYGGTYMYGLSNACYCTVCMKDVVSMYLCIRFAS